jgi:cell division protein FtsI/penicillin-binding protein 2
MPLSHPVREARQVRFGVIAALALAGFALVVVGLLRLQVVQHAEYLELAKENRVRLEVLRAPRGSIFDRHGDLLADSAPSFSVVYRPFPAESTHLVRATLEHAYLARVARLVNQDTAQVLAPRHAAADAGRGGGIARRAAGHRSHDRADPPLSEWIARGPPAWLRRRDQRRRARFARSRGLPPGRPDRPHRHRALV